MSLFADFYRLIFLLKITEQKKKNKKKQVKIIFKFENIFKQTSFSLSNEISLKTFDFHTNANGNLVGFINLSDFE